MDLFALKKLASLFLHLVPGCLILILVSMALARIRRWQRISSSLILVNVLVLILASTPVVSNRLINSLEDQFSVMMTPPDDTVLFLTLGNYATADDSLPANARLGAVALSRITETIRLWRQQQQAMIFLGGPSRFAMRDFAIDSGVAGARIVVDHDVRDTIEEIAAATQHVQSGNLAGRIVIVSSATHLPRSKLIADHVVGLRLTNLSPPAYSFAPADFIAAPIDRTIHASSGYLQKTDRVVHEYIGMLWIKLKFLVTSY